MTGPNSPTIAEIKSGAPESLWHFLGQLPGSWEAQVWYGLVLGGILGMLGHYIRGRSAGNISGSPIDYFFRDNVWRSVASASAVAGELFAEIGAGLFTTEAGIFVGWGLVIVSGIKSGYGLDSLVNKSSRDAWTPEKRAALATAKAAVDTPPSAQNPAVQTVEGNRSTVTNSPGGGLP